MNQGLKTEKLSVLARGVPILQDITLGFEAGQTHVILGPSGSGKTTFLRCLNRLNDLFDGLQVKGQVTVPWEGGPRSIYGSGLPVEQLRRQVAMVFQNPNVLPVSIRENFRIPLESVLQSSPAEVERRMEETLVETGLWDEVSSRLDQSAVRLSGGQQQRLCLARALALDPAVLLLDEPTANLDFRATARVENLLGRLKKDRVLLMVSHSLDQSIRLADRVVAMDSGSVVLDTEVNEGNRFGPLKEEVAGLFPAG